MSEITLTEHLHPTIRRVLELFESGRLDDISAVDTEIWSGDFARLTWNDGHTTFAQFSDLGVNAATSSSIADNKAFTKDILATHGFAVPRGVEFALPVEYERLQRSRHGGRVRIRTLEHAAKFAEQELGAPWYVKPAYGSKGADIVCLDSISAILELCGGQSWAKHPYGLIEERIHFPVYRLVTFRGHCEFAYRTIPFTVTGDGHSDIDSLIIRRLAERNCTDSENLPFTVNRSRIEQHLSMRMLCFQDVPRNGDEIELMPVSNMSQGGSAYNVSDQIHESWKGRAVEISSALNLDLAGIDLACENIEDPDSRYAVLEVNARPALHGDAQGLLSPIPQPIIDNLIVKILST